MKIFFDWLDERTDYRKLLTPIRLRVLPNGPRWAYSTASCLLWLFVVQLVTGLLLMLSYSPSTTTAWASVHYIEQSAAGHFLRGMHHFTSHALIILCGVHVVRVLLVRAFRAPRELLWITGLLLFPLMLVWAISGNPLTGGLKGVSQIEVEGNIIGSTPWVGPIIQRIFIGGEEVGHLTLTHLYFLHVGLLPLLVIGLLLFHIAQVYRHGLSVAEVGGPQDDVSRWSAPNLANMAAAHPVPTMPPRLRYYPHQTVRNMIVLTVVLGIIAAFAWQHGAPLDAPADPTLPNTPRPEWYFRSLFELRRYFTGDWEFMATIIIPAGVLGFFVLFPLLDRKCSPRVSAVLRVLVVLCGAGTWGGLTGMSYLRDWKDAEFIASSAETEALAVRARELADHSLLPPEGPITLLRDDPKTQGPLLFARHCAGCHSHADTNGHGIVASDPSAPNLHGFGTTEWIRGMLDPQRIASSQFFGKTKFAKGDMVSKVHELFDGLEDADAAKLREDLKLVALALSDEADLPRSAGTVHDHHAPLAAGRELLLSGRLACTDCHRFRDQGELGSAPDLNGYGSRDWLLGMIGNPRHERFYSDDRNDRMPAFAEDTQHPEHNLLSPRELTLIVDWLRGDWYEPTTSSQPTRKLKPRSAALATTRRP